MVKESKSKSRGSKAWQKRNPLEHSIDQRLGAALRDARIEAGLSQTALGAALGISFQQVQKYENGLNRLSISRLLSITAVSGIDWREIVKKGAGDDVPQEATIGDRRHLEIVRLAARMPLNIVVNLGKLMRAITDLEAESEK